MEVKKRGGLVIIVKVSGYEIFLHFFFCLYLEGDVSA